MRKRAKQALQVSEDQYRLLAENVADGIAITQQGRLVFANRALTAMLNASASDLLDKPLQNVLMCDQFAEHEHQIQRLLNQEIDAFSWEAHCLNGTSQPHWLDIRHTRIEWHNTPSILLTIRDVTVSKLRELDIQQERNHLKQEVVALQATIKDPWKFGEIVGKSPAMQRVYALIAQAAATQMNVLIYGDSGVGKELVARTIHQLSYRREQPFVVVNCGAITGTLFEREFFGHRKGAFTGADRDQSGFFASAQHGTLFLDEIGELPLTMQVKLLRAIETGEYTPVGDTRARTADVRIIAATNRNPDKMLEQGTMREDFYYRICILLIGLPALRDHREDIPLLIEHFLTQYSPARQPEHLPAALRDALRAYDWPGNVRQLQTELQRYLATGEASISLSPETPPRTAPPELLPGIPEGTGLAEAVAQFEKQLILNALRRADGHKSKAAALLNINRKTLYKKMKQHGVR